MPFLPAPRQQGGYTGTCSYECGMTLRYRKPPTPMRLSCEVCGGEYRKTYTGQRTCGRKCGAELQARERPPVEPKPRFCRVWSRNCEQCGRPFMARRERTRFCGDNCSDCWHNAAQARARAAVRPVRLCAVCNAPIADAGFKACAEHRAEYKRQRKRRAEHARKQRLKPGGYTLAQIAGRDGYRCGICRRQVDMTLPSEHERGPTIDHIVPISLGGDDLPENVQLAHRHCNCAVKRASVGSGVQPALF